MKYKKTNKLRQKLNYIDEQTFGILEFTHNFKQITSWTLSIGKQIITGLDVDALAKQLQKYKKVFPIYVYDIKEFGSFVLVERESECEDEAIWQGFPFRSLASVTMLQSMDDIKQVYGSAEQAVLSLCQNWNYSPLYLPHSASRIILNSMDCKFPKVQEHILPLARKAKAGGLITFNENYKGKQLENIHHVDICSAYPAALYNEKFPTRFSVLPSDIITLKSIRKCCNSDTACLVEANYHIDNFDKHKKQLDNIPKNIEADALGWVGTEYDVDFLCRRFGDDLKIDIMRVYTAKKNYLPDEVRTAVKNLFLKKQQAKAGTPERLQAKLFVNIIAGNFQRDPEQVSKYGNLPPMIWGIWLTSMVRHKILMAQQKLIAAGCDVLYGDTDSIFWLGKEIDLNDGIRISEEMSADGKYAGLFYDEGDGAEFIMFGRKQYILDDEPRLAGGYDDDSLMWNEYGFLEYQLTQLQYSQGKGIIKKVNQIIKEVAE